MGTKSFFNKQKSQEVKIRGQEKSTIEDVKQNVESIDYVKELMIDPTKPDATLFYGKLSSNYIQ